MISKHYYQIFFWLCLLSTILLSLMPMTGRQLFEMQDKVGHAGIYAALYFLAAQAYGDRLSLWLLAIILVLFGLSMEFAQSMTGYRYADLWDALANSAGILSIWIILMVRRRFG
jgi:VanZ family protein